MKNLNISRQLIWLHFCLVCLITNNFLAKFKHSTVSSFKEETFRNKWKHLRIHLHFVSLWTKNGKEITET